MILNWKKNQIAAHKKYGGKLNIEIFPIFSFGLVQCTITNITIVFYIMCEIVIRKRRYYNMMASSNRNSFIVTGPLCGEFTGHRWIAGNSPVTVEFPSQRSVTRCFDAFFICASINGSVNNSEAGVLRRHRAHYDVIVMVSCPLIGMISLWIVTFVFN